VVVKFTPISTNRSRLRRGEGKVAKWLGGKKNVPLKTALVPGGGCREGKNFTFARGGCPLLASSFARRRGDEKETHRPGEKMVCPSRPFRKSESTIKGSGPKVFFKFPSGTSYRNEPEKGKRGKKEKQ